ncbi:hypothetical protein BDZ91DRAFT_723880 [Kalaharituber pfeilii]|nr:hypothetical protein BDZ91DRAFT_723880 [Kalaharituber pfeilii]
MSTAPASSPVRIRQPTASESNLVVPNPTPTSWIAHAQKQPPLPPPNTNNSSSPTGDLDSQELLSKRGLLAEAVKRASVAIVIRDMQDLGV